jgi:hypothetical protein
MEETHFQTAAIGDDLQWVIGMFAPSHATAIKSLLVGMGVSAFAVAAAMALT